MYLQHGWGKRAPTMSVSDLYNSLNSEPIMCSDVTAEIEYHVQQIKKVSKHISLLLSLMQFVL